jgi:hydrocephalus-inducing protein
VRINQDVTKTVSILNLSKKAINLNFDFGAQFNEMKKDYLSVVPAKEFTIMPRDKKEVEVRFNPRSRLHHFKREIFYHIVENQEERKLLTVQGACHGIELKLMEDAVSFGAVVINSKVTKRVQLANLGDIGTKFEWDTQFCKHVFTISPERGFAPAHEDLYFDITFHPNVIDNDIRFKKVKIFYKLYHQ